MMRWLYRWADGARHRARTRRWAPQAAWGRRGEDLAQRFLQRRGFTVVARNYRHSSGSGEIDLVAWHGETLVFVEVKSRASEEFGTPDRAVDQEKQRHLARVARDFARRASVDWNRVRFDIVNVMFSDPPRIDLIQDAFRP